MKNWIDEVVKSHLDLKWECDEVTNAEILFSTLHQNRQESKSNRESRYTCLYICALLLTHGTQEHLHPRLRLLTLQTATTFLPTFYFSSAEIERKESHKNNLFLDGLFPMPIHILFRTNHFSKSFFIIPNYSFQPHNYKNINYFFTSNQLINCLKKRIALFSGKNEGFLQTNIIVIKGRFNLPSIWRTEKNSQSIRICCFNWFLNTMDCLIGEREKKEKKVALRVNTFWAMEWTRVGNASSEWHLSRRLHPVPSRKTVMWAELQTESAPMHQPPNKIPKQTKIMLSSLQYRSLLLTLQQNQ